MMERPAIKTPERKSLTEKAKNTLENLRQAGMATFLGLALMNGAAEAKKVTSLKKQPTPVENNIPNTNVPAGDEYMAKLGAAQTVNTVEPGSLEEVLDKADPGYLKKLEERQNNPVSE